MLTVHQFVFSLFGENTYLLVDQATKEAAVVDPGMNDAEEYEAFDATVKRIGAHITQIINTHMHLDHCFGVNYVKSHYNNVPLKAHELDRQLGKGQEAQLKMMHLRGNASQVEIDEPLVDGDTIEIGESHLQVIHTPGHSQGSICLYYQEGGWLIAGDTLFQGSIGRTDLAGGNHSQLINSIKSKLFTLPGSTVVLPGHGDATTIDNERKSNPYLR